LVIAAFVTALFWAKARDPFRRIEFSVRISDGTKAKGIAVLPKTVQSFPVAVYLHGSGGSLLQSGNELRLLAEQNIAAVGLEYIQTNQASFDEQFIALHKYLARQSWVRKSESGARYQVSGQSLNSLSAINHPLSTNSIAWIGSSLGAQRELSFLLRHPEYQPSLLVRLGGGWVEELGEKSEARNSKLETTQSVIHHPLSTNTHFLLVHGENDEVFSAADCRKLAELLKQAGLPGEVRVFPGLVHGFGSDKLMIVRGVGEYCANFFGTLQPLHLNTRPLLLHYWLPFALLVAVVLVVQYVRWRAWRKAAGIVRDKWSTALLVVAWILGTAAIVDTAFHLGLPRLQVNESRLHLARRWLLQPHLRNDFDWLAQQPIWKEQKLKTLLEHLELADYNRSIINWKYDEPVYREFILSPTLDQSAINDQPSTPLSWRRPLWENFYPRIRRENNPLDAAQMVVRFLRERVTVVSDGAVRVHSNKDIQDIWETELTDAAEFERIYVAALRSVGIAARLNEAGQAELFAENKWQSAPRPLLMSAADAFGAGGASR
jgi:predicted esterase